MSVTFSEVDPDLKNRMKKSLVLREKRQSYGQMKYSGEKILLAYSIDNGIASVPLNFATSNCPGISNPIRVNTGKFELKTTLRPYQKEIVPEAVAMYGNNGQCFFNVYCSYGKTVVGAYFSSLFAKTYGCRTLVVYPRLLIQDSWIGTFQNLTNAKIHVYDGKPIPQEAQVVLCMNTKVKNMTVEERLSFSHFIVDEAHMFCTETGVPTILSIQPKFLTLLTATEDRNDGFESFLRLLVGNNVIRQISSKPFYVIKVESKISVPQEILRYTTFGLQFSSVEEYLSNCDERNRLIRTIVSSNPFEKILILVKYVEHAKHLEHLLKMDGTDVRSIYGKIPTYEDGRVVIATYSKIGVGFDEREACTNWNGKRLNVLILASSVKSVEQFAGRVFRSEVPIVFDIVDDQKNCKEHFRLRRKWYESRNGKICQVKNSSYACSANIFNYKEDVDESTPSIPSLIRSLAL